MNPDTLRIVAFSDEASRQLGYSPQELRGLRLVDIGIESVVETYRRRAPGGLPPRVFTVDAVARTKDGREHPARVRVNAVVSGGRTLLQAVVHALRESPVAPDLEAIATRLRHTLSATSEGVWDWNVNTGEVFLSDNWLASLGFAREDVQPTVEFWASLVHPDDWATVTQALEAHLAGKTLVYECEYRLRMKSGEYQHNLDRGRVVEWNEDGSPARMVGTNSDLTDRRRTVEALAASEAKFLTLFQAAPDAIFLMEGDVFVDCNRSAEVLFGHSKQELLGQSPIAFSPARQPDGRSSAEAATEWIRAAEAGTPQRFAWQHSRADGAILDTEVSLNRVDAGGRTYLHAIVRDMTARRATERALSESEQYLAASQRIAQVGHWVVDLQTGAATWSEELYRIFGLSPETVAATPERFFALVHPDDRPLLQAWIAKATAGECPGALQFRIVRPNGDIRLVEGDGEIQMGAANTPVRLYGIAMDVTARVHLDESLRLQGAALNAAANGIVITDRAGTIEWVNPAFSALTGYSLDEALGKNPRDLVRSGAHDAAFFADLWKTILAGRPWQGQIVNRRKDGTLYTEEQSVTPIIDASGAITHFVAVKQDISERLKLEAQFRQAQKMEVVGRLASGIAHDFNNLLTVINGLSELLLAQPGVDSAAREDLHEINRAGQRAARLTRQLLAFSRQQIQTLQPLSLTTVLTGLEGLLRRLLGEDIELTILNAPDLGTIKADLGQLEQIVTNLAVNARDAMPQGGRLIIETHNVSIDAEYCARHGVNCSPGPYAMLAITDSGVGMDESTRAHIFEPFFTTKKPGEGTGLGLSTVYGIVKQTGGFVWVYSESGRGTTFKVYLPQMGAATVAPQAPSGPTPETGTGTILLVEDSTALRNLAARILQSAGYTVHCASDGQEALTLMQTRRPAVDLLVTDVVMPGVNGRVVAEQVGALVPGVRVLYMSGYTGDTLVRQGVLEGDVVFLSKPFTGAALLQQVRAALES